MYKEHYGLKENPFSMLPDPSFLYLGKKHSLALAMLQYAMMNQATITVLTGEIGSGKTTIVRHLLNQSDDDTQVGLLSNTHSRFGELMQWVNLAFGLPYEGKSKVALHQVFIEYSIEQYAKGRRLVLIIDEAQNLDVDTLEEIRLLSNINADKDHILQLLLVGQPQLYRKLRKPELEQFIQRISFSYHLKSLSLDETNNYISHRLTVAGGNPDLFEPQARRIIHKKSRGIPRLINVLCETALIYGFADRKKIIDEHLVHEVVQDKIESGLMAPNRASRGNQPQNKSSHAAKVPAPTVTDNTDETDDHNDTNPPPNRLP